MRLGITAPKPANRAVKAPAINKASTATATMSRAELRGGSWGTGRIDGENPRSSNAIAIWSDPRRFSSITGTISGRYSFIRLISPPEKAIPRAFCDSTTRDVVSAKTGNNLNAKDSVKPTAGGIFKVMRPAANSSGLVLEAKPKAITTVPVIRNPIPTAYAAPSVVTVYGPSENQTTPDLIYGGQITRLATKKTARSGIAFINRRPAPQKKAANRTAAVNMADKYFGSLNTTSKSSPPSSHKILVAGCNLRIPLSNVPPEDFFEFRVSETRVTGFCRYFGYQRRFDT